MFRKHCITYCAGLLVLLGWLGPAPIASHFGDPRALQGVSVVYFPETGDVLLSVAWHLNPLSTAGDVAPLEGFALEIFFDNQIHPARDSGDRYLAWNLDAPLAGLLLRAAGDVPTLPPRAVLQFAQSHDGKVVTLRFPLALLGDADGKFWVVAGSVAGQRLSTRAIPATCDGRPATLVGTAGHDVLYAPLVGEHDVILGLGGNDIIYGSQRDDIICGGDGDDQLYGGGGNDRLFGEDGDDLLHGEFHDDYLDGGNGNDMLLGGRSDDTLIGFRGIDACAGGAGEEDAADASCEFKTGVE